MTMSKRKNWVVTVVLAGGRASLYGGDWSNDSSIAELMVRAASFMESASKQASTAQQEWRRHFKRTTVVSSSAS